MRGFFRILDSFVQNNQKNVQNSIIFVHFAGSLAIASCRFPGLSLLCICEFENG
jgi:hypothetical protein